MAANVIPTLPEQWLHDMLHDATGLQPYPAHRSDLLSAVPSVGYIRTETERRDTLGPLPTPITRAAFEVSILAGDYISGKMLADQIRRAINKEAVLNFSGAYTVAKILGARITAEADDEAEYIDGRDDPVAYSVALAIDINFEEEP